MVKLVKAGSEELDSYLKALIMGESGAGKTYCSVTAPNPVIMLTERNGMQSVKQSNPDALVAYCSTANECRDFLLAAMNGDLPDHVETIVIDGITEVQQIMIDDILANKGGGDRKMSLPDWGVLGDRMRRFLRCLRDLPYHVVATTLVNHELNDATGEMRVFPLVQSKKLPSMMAANFNVVGLLFKREVEGVDDKKTVVRKIMVEGPSRFMVKPCTPIGGILDADLGEWVNMWKESQITEPSANGKKQSNSSNKTVGEK